MPIEKLPLCQRNIPNQRVRVEMLEAESRTLALSSLKRNLYSLPAALK